MNFIRRINMANWWYESYGKIPNFSSISLKLRLLGQKNTGTWVVNTVYIHFCDGSNMIGTDTVQHIKIRPRSLINNTWD